MKTYHYGVASIFVVMLIGSAGAATYIIRADGTGDYVTIGDGMTAAADGDTLLLAAGTFKGPGNRDVDFQGKAVTVVSESGPQVTIIDLENSGRAFNMSSGEGPGSVLSGLAIVNGHGDVNGGAINCEGPGSSPTIENCIFRDNYAAYSGGAIFFRDHASPLITNCVFEDNFSELHAGGVCFYGNTNSATPTFTGCVFARNANAAPGYGGGALLTPTSVVISDCLFLDNHTSGAGGAIGNGGEITGCTFVGNTAEGEGSAIAGWEGPSISHCTFYGNAGPQATVSNNAGGEMLIANSIIASSHQGSAVICLSGTTDVVCCDIWDNAGGDYIGCIAGLEGVVGNFSADPHFCGLDPQDLHLYGASPCAPGQHPAGDDCGLIGAWPVGCGAPIMVADVPDDQGGLLTVAWPRLEPWIFGGETEIAFYHVQRQVAGDWVTVASLPSAGTDTVSTVVETSDIYVVGDPPPYSDYRVAAEDVDAEIFYPSEVDSGYSVDNLPPPQPQVQLYEYDAFVVVAWDAPDIPDFHEACVYRGTTPDFVPEAPYICTQDPGIGDHFSVMYYYWVQFADIHGSLSEFSEMVHPDPTAVGGGRVPAALALLPPYPNPFNPRTTVSFTLPGTGHVLVAIYDAGGHEVARLVDETLGAGEYSRNWHGTDVVGKVLPSGTYLCRLSTPWGMETRKLQLVR